MDSEHKAKALARVAALKADGEARRAGRALPPKRRRPADPEPADPARALAVRREELRNGRGQLPALVLPGVPHAEPPLLVDDSWPFEGWRAATLYEVKLWPKDLLQQPWQPRNEQPPQACYVGLTTNCAERKKQHGPTGAPDAGGRTKRGPEAAAVIHAIHRQLQYRSDQVFRELRAIPAYGHVGGRLRETCIVARDIAPAEHEYTLLGWRVAQVGVTVVRGGPWLRPGPQDTWPQRERDALADLQDVLRHWGITGREEGPVCQMSLDKTDFLTLELCQLGNAPHGWAQVYQVIQRHDLLRWFIEGQRCAGCFETILTRF